ncbi:ATP/GTP-binding protein [Actinomyces slackii]|uniref:Predicted ATPase n=1 Tax=Actinomyces slackii TaxID=52774 RepID=A0A448K9Q4_9ACTO|nr:ATP-binding protein [Actinomyces slackii]VEG73701.1 Predicted ATPase [Actinomyces slackii]
MLLDVTVSNFRCFADEAPLSFVAPSLRTQTPRPPQTWITSTYRAAAVLGANASGKSTILDALQVLGAAVATPGTLLYHPHAMASADRPTTYDVNFTADNTRYHYVVEALPWGIRSETLRSYPKGTSRLMFSREQSGPEATVTVKTGPSLKGPTAEVKRLLTSTDLMLAVAARYNHSTLRPIARSIRFGAGIVGVNRSEQGRDAWMQWVMSRMIEDPQHWPGIVRALTQMADLGITDVEVREREIPPELLARLRALLAADAEDAPSQIPEDALPTVMRSLVFTHAAQDGSAFELGVGSQSTGTMTWLATAAPAVAALARGDLLVVDELDASLHPALTAAVIEMFKSPELNTTGAQILFSTHDTTLLGNSPKKILDPGEVWFCEKRGASSELFSLDDFDSRPGNNEQKRYLAGRFGAIPDVDFSEVLASIDLSSALPREA